MSQGDGEAAPAMIMTVTGPVLPGDLGPGVMSFQEHLYIKSSPLFPPKGTEDKMQVDEKGADAMAHVSMDILGALREDPFWVMDNCMLNQEDSAHAELRSFLSVGGHLVVEATPSDLARNPRALRKASEVTGVKVVMGCGYGVGHSHPPHIDGESEESIAAEIEREVKGGVLESDADNRIHPGVIGAIGISTLTAAEATVLRGAAIAQSKTGCPLLVKVSGGECTVASACVEAVKVAGGDIESTCLSGMGASCTDWEGHKALLGMGCCLVYDGAGCYGYFPEGGGVQFPGDDVLAAAVKRAVDAGFAGKILLSHGGFLKMHRCKWGGAGIAHLAGSFIPRLERLGISRRDITMMVQDNPRRLLTFYVPPPPSPPMVPMFTCDACGKVSPFGKEFTKFDYIMCSGPCLTKMRKKTDNWTAVPK